VTRRYLDVNRHGKVTGFLDLTDERALDLLTHGFDLRPFGWSIADLIGGLA